MKILIVGSRDFNNYEMLKNAIDTAINTYGDVEIVSGRC